MKAELSTSLALLCFGAVVHANVPIQQTAAEPGFVCNFQIQTSVVPGQPASAYRFDKLFLNGAEYGGPAANTAASLDGRGRSWCYNGTHVGEGPAAAPPSIAYGTGLKLEAFMNVKTLWNPVWATSWMVSGTPTPSKSGFWKVVLGKPIVWTQQNKNYYEIRWGGWLGKPSPISSVYREF